MIGAGKYDHLCTYAREQAKARAAILILIGGELGSGFSCQTPASSLPELANYLRVMADQVEKDAKHDFTDLTAGQ